MNTSDVGHGLDVAVRVAVGSALCFAWLFVDPTAAAAGGVVTEGSLEYHFFAYPDGGTRRDASESFLDVDLRVRGTLSPTLSYLVDLRAVADDAGFTAGMLDPLSEDQRRPYVSFPVAALDWTPREEVRLSVGRQIINWSGIDEIQPANLMTPLDESDLFRRGEFGAYALTTHVALPSVSFDLAIVPAVFQPTRLPQGRWRFAPDDFDMSQDSTPTEFDETQVGFRIGSHAGALEISTFAYTGRDMLPYFTLETPQEPQGRPLVLARNARTRAAGFSASLPIGESWLLRSELVYYSSPDSRRDDFLQHVPLGVEFVHGDWRVVLNYLRYDRTSSGTGAVSQGERSFYRSFLFGEVMWDRGGPCRGRLRAGHDLDRGFFLVEPSVSWRVWRDLRLGFEALVIVGGGGSDYFDLISNEDRVGVSLQYHL